MKTSKIINSLMIFLSILLISCRNNNNKYLEITDEKMKQVPNEITNNVVLIPQNDELFLWNNFSGNGNILF